MMVFFSSCLSVKYHHELLNYIDLPVMSIHVSILCGFVFGNMIVKDAADGSKLGAVYTERQPQCSVNITMKLGILLS